MSVRAGPVQPGGGASELHDRLSQARLAAILGRPQVGADELDLLVARVAGIYSNAICNETRSAYARRWMIFQAWCDKHGYDALPAAPETVMVYIASAVDDDGVALSTLRGWIAAINRVHIEAGLPSPGADPAMSMFLKGLSRLAPSRRKPEPVRALRIAALREVCALIDASALDPVEVRDRAMLGLHTIGIGDGELSRLVWADIHLTARTLRVSVRPVGRQRHVRTRTVRAHKDPGSCPVAAMHAWWDMSQPRGPSQPVFCLIDGGRLLAEPFKNKRAFAIRTSRLRSLGHGERATAPDAMRLLGVQPPIETRDKAILLLGFAGAFRRNEVTNLRWSDLTIGQAGLTIHLRRSKTDQSGQGRSVGVPYGKNPLTCPVAAYLKWKQRVEDQHGKTEPEGRVFTHVGRAGRITERPISPEALTQMVKTRAALAGLEGKWGGRSLRAGFISTAADLDVPLEEIASQSRHATLDSLVRYIRRDDLFRRNPAARVGL